MEQWGTIMFGYDTILRMLEFGGQRVNDSLVRWLNYIPHDFQLEMGFVVAHETRSFVGCPEDKCTKVAIAHRLSGACNRRLEELREDGRKRLEDELEYLKNGRY